MLLKFGKCIISKYRISYNEILNLIKYSTYTRMTADGAHGNIEKKTI